MPLIVTNIGWSRPLAAELSHAEVNQALTDTVIMSAYERFAGASGT